MECVYQDISAPECDVEMSGFLYLHTKSLHNVFEEFWLVAYPAKTRFRQLNLSLCSPYSRMALRNYSLPRFAWDMNISHRWFIMLIRKNSFGHYANWINTKTRERIQKYHSHLIYRRKVMYYINYSSVCQELTYRVLVGRQYLKKKTHTILNRCLEL